MAKTPIEIRAMLRVRAKYHASVEETLRLKTEYAESIKHAHDKGFSIRKLAAILGVHRNCVFNVIRSDSYTGRNLFRTL